MKQKTNMMINEADMLQIIVKLEMYMENLLNNHKAEKEPAYYKEVKELHNKMQQIWWEMKPDEDYILLERPF